VRVDEAGDDVAAARLQGFVALVVPQPGDVAVADGHVRLQPLAREGDEDAAAPDDKVCGLVAPGDGEPAGEIGHAEP
jgi:hypothetical protein